LRNCEFGKLNSLIPKFLNPSIPKFAYLSEPPEEFRAQPGRILGSDHLLDETDYRFFISGKPGLDGQVVGGMVGGKIAVGEIGLGDDGSQFFQ